MNDLVGIIRKEDEVQRALDAIDTLKTRVRDVSVEGHRQFNPGWHLALDLRNMLLVGECVARAALARQESRGGHTRDDYPGMNAEWRRKLLVCSMHEGGTGGPAGITLTEEPSPAIREDLLELFDRSELEKYLTADELPADTGATGGAS
jgi:succinate dehydrogenase / fumarate reductase, flavoprotein subunit